MTNLLKGSIKGVIIFSSAIAMLCCTPAQPTGQSVGQFAVVTIEPTQAQLKSAYVASVKGKQDVEIRSKVNGFITKVCVADGAIVKKGQTLLIIDPVEYQAAVTVAQAAVSVAKANVATSQLTLDNKRQLEQKNIISKYDLQLAENQLASMQAILEQANAQLTNARNNLSYTNVTSPSNGIVSVIPFRVGSLVGSSTAAPLTIVSDISQMYVYFSMDEKQLLQMTRQNQNISSALDKMPMVELQLADGTIYAEKGKIETVSGVIDPATGTVTLRATFPNKSNILRSGGTGSVLIPYTNDNAIIIPQRATYEIQDKKFVYLLSDSSSVVSTEIEISPLNNGSDYIVLNGLTPGDKIVVEGISSLRNGVKIEAITPEQSTANKDALKKSK